MEYAIKVFILILSGMALLTWQQPTALFSLATMIERWAGRLVRWLRIRACAKADAQEAYRRSYAWYSSLS